jgi:RNA polymerase sporulation-specific sigma factor
VQRHPGERGVPAGWAGVLRGLRGWWAALRSRSTLGRKALRARGARGLVLWLRARFAPPAPVHYVGGADALPAPLSAEEEEELIARLAAGDPSAKAPLIERNLRLVVYIARKFDNTRIAIEDLISIGAIGLIKAVNSFDPGKRIKLATYASKCIENEILMFLRRSARTRSEVSFDQPLNVDWDGNELLLQDIHGTDPDLVYRDLEDEADRVLLRKALTKLTRRERRIVELRYGLQDGVERTQKQVADCLGISQSYISRLEKRIIRRLRKEMQRTG